MNTQPPIADDDSSDDLGTRVAASGPAGTPNAASGGGAAEDGTPIQEAEGPAGASAGNTHLLSSQWFSDPSLPFHDKVLLSQLLSDDRYSGPVALDDLYANAVVAVDWLETGGLIRWEEDSRVLLQVERLREAAGAAGQPEPYVLCDQEVLIYPKGIGSGKQQHLPYRIEWPGVMLAFDTRNQDSRQHGNWYLKVTGEGCVQLGAMTCYRKAGEIVQELGGVLYDQWVKRIDFALDLPDVDLKAEFLDAFRQEHFLTSSKSWNPYDGPEGCSGFTVGTMNRVKLNVYDKLRQAKKKDELYQLAMQQNRWGGRIPNAATRIEYQIRKPWLDEYGLCRADDVFRMIPAIISRLAELEKRPFFAMTNGPVDRKNKHQNRCGRLPAWVKAVATFQTLAGQPHEPLERVNRELIGGKRALQSAMGFLTSAAAKSGRCIATSADLVEFLREQIERNEVVDEDIFQKWEKKARKEGTFRESQDFRFGNRSDAKDEQEEEECF
ncbi:MAG: hypothetical protein H6824_03645 [Planctomycetaceae bacterium]|nr:hypothetical protein [Planctomycetaceae bacterium]